MLARPHRRVGRGAPSRHAALRAQAVRRRERDLFRVRAAAAPRPPPAGRSARRGETISAIAFACGFGDLSYFNRVFCRHYGATPTVVREAARGSATDDASRGAGNGLRRRWLSEGSE
jgi:AraC-like DNA-binding protein